MSLFCFLWTPLFYLYRRSLSAGEAGSGGVWAILLGSLTAVFRFLLGSFVNPGGFGFSRWMSGFVDVVCLPALLPLVVYFVFMFLRVVSGTADFANFALLWLIPVAAIRAVVWSSVSDPILLIVVPLLWTAIACGIPLFVGGIAAGKPPVIAASAFGILALPALAATAYWAFFSQRTLLGFAALAASLVPPVISLIQTRKAP
jgi:hypothetical protein